MVLTLAMKGLYPGGGKLNEYDAHAQWKLRGSVPATEGLKYYFARTSGRGFSFHIYLMSVKIFWYGFACFYI